MPPRRTIIEPVHAGADGRPRLVHLPRDDDAVVDLYADNVGDELATLSLVRGHAAASTLRVDAAPPRALGYGDTLWADGAPVGVCVGVRAPPLDAQPHPLHVAEDGSCDVPSASVGDVFLVDDGHVCVVQHTSAAAGARCDRAPPAGLHERWSVVRRAGCVDGEGVVSATAGGRLAFSHDHGLCSGDLLVVLAGGAPHVRRVASAHERRACEVDAPPPVAADCRWRRVELTPALLAVCERPVQAGQTLTAGARNHFGDAAFDAPTRVGTVSLVLPPGEDGDDELRVSLRPRAQQTRVLPGIPLPGGIDGVLVAVQRDAGVATVQLHGSACTQERRPVPVVHT